MTSISKLTILISGLLGAANASAECPVCELANGPLMVRQIPESQERVREYFKGYELPDTIYAIVLPVGTCPRCEALIMPIFNTIKKLRHDATTVMIAGHTNTRAARDYLHKQGISADVEIYDNDKTYEDFLSCNIGMIHVPYMLRIVPQEGSVPMALHAFSNRRSLIAGFLDGSIELEPKAFAYSSRSTHMMYNAPLDSIIYPVKHIPVEQPEGMAYSAIRNRPDFCGNILAFNDQLHSEIVMLKLNDAGDKFVHMGIIKADSTEMFRFVDLPTTYSLEDYDDGSLKFMPISPRFMPDGRLAVSYSLPRLWEDGTECIGYANQPCMLLVDTCNLTHTLTAFEDGTSHGQFFGHYTIFPLGDDVAMMSQPRTWPLTEKSAYDSVPELNPFDKTYYSGKHVMAVFSTDKGRFIRLAGKLPAVAEKSRTGHAFARPLSDTFDGCTAICDGYSGEISFFMADGTQRLLEAYHIDPHMLPDPDSTMFHTYDISAQYESWFCRHIDDMKLSKDHVTCLVRYGDVSGMSEPAAYSVIVIDRSTGKACERRIADGDDKAHSYGLRRDATGNVSPYRICINRNGDWLVELF